jgi:hypothetical protein
MTNDKVVPLPLPLWDAYAPRSVAIARLKEAIGRWVSVDELWDLVEVFDATSVDRSDVASAVAFIDDVAARHWDFRQGGERQSLRRDLSSHVVALVNLVAARFGLLRRSNEPKGSYDDMLVLGGTVRACYSRMALGKSLLQSSVTCRAMTALGGFRPLQPDELEFARDLLGGDVRTEAEGLVAMARVLYGVDDAPIRQLGDQAEAIVVDAPIRVSVLGVRGSGGRARTEDTYRFWAQRSPWTSTAPRRVIIVTSQIYVPYQHLEAIRVLAKPRGWYLETVGSEPGEFLPLKPAPALQPAHYLQEIRSTLHAMRRLMMELANV